MLVLEDASNNHGLYQTETKRQLGIKVSAHSYPTEISSWKSQTPYFCKILCMKMQQRGWCA